jgi:hypothetical protein
VADVTTSPALACIRQRCHKLPIPQGAELPLPTEKLEAAPPDYGLLEEAVGSSSSSSSSSASASASGTSSSGASSSGKGEVIARRPGLQWASKLPDTSAAGGAGTADGQVVDLFSADSSSDSSGSSSIGGKIGLSRRSMLSAKIHGPDVTRLASSSSRISSAERKLLQFGGPPAFVLPDRQLPMPQLMQALENISAYKVIRFKDAAAAWGGFADASATTDYEAWLATVSTNWCCNSEAVQQQASLSNKMKLVMKRSHTGV